MRAWLAAVLICLVLPCAAAAQELDAIEWRLKGYDVFGVDSRTAREIAASYPARIGDRVKAADKPQRDAWRRSLAQARGYHDVKCTLVLIQPEDAYFTVDIVGTEAEARRWGAERRRSSVRLDGDLVEAHRRLDALKTKRVAGNFPVRDVVVENAFVTYVYPELKASSAELRRMAEPRRAHILDVLRNGADASDRAVAANLLQFAGNAVGVAAEAAPLLDDPDPMVRNNLARFLVLFAPRLTEPGDRRRVALAAARQLERPGVGDRNKGVFMLTRLYDADPGLRPVLAEASCARLKHIAERSVAPNVGGVAKALLRRFDADPQVRSACPA